MTWTAGEGRTGRSPTTALLLGLIITLAAVVADSWYVTRQIAGLRVLQTDLADRSRKDSLQLLRIQNDLNSLGLAMRDMLDSDEPYPLTAWTAQFERIRLDLDDALRSEEAVAVVAPHARAAPVTWATRVAQFWDAVDRIFALAARRPRGRGARRRSGSRCRRGRPRSARRVARLLVREQRERGADRGPRAGHLRAGAAQVYLFLAATLRRDRARPACT